jgi:hypothetical protein
MKVQEQIAAYVNSQPEPKLNELQALQKLVRKVLPKGKLWFFDGKDEKGKMVSNPNIGFGAYNIQYADGTTREFYQIGLSANTSGISVYVMGIKDKTYLPKTFGKKIGKATVTGYCIKFKTTKDINLDVLEAAMLAGVKATSK